MIRLLGVVSLVTVIIAWQIVKPKTKETISVFAFNCIASVISIIIGGTPTVIMFVGAVVVHLIMVCSLAVAVKEELSLRRTEKQKNLLKKADKINRKSNIREYYIPSSAVC